MRFGYFLSNPMKIFSKAFRTPPTLGYRHRKVKNVLLRLFKVNSGINIQSFEVLAAQGFYAFIKISATRFIEIKQRFYKNQVTAAMINNPPYPQPKLKCE